MVLTSNTEMLFKQLKRRLQGDVLTQRADRILYSSDASIYQQLPLAVVKPRNREDCLQLFAFAREHQLAIIPRAGGTSLAGQVVGKAIIVDVSRYMRNIIEIDETQQTALVEPGVIIESLDNKVKPLGLKFAPDPSTLNRCTISGVIGNNAWGAHAPIYGSTRDHVLETELVLSNGEIVQTHSLSKTAFDDKLQLAGKEGEIYRLIDSLIAQHKSLIDNRFPKKQDLICNAGYALHELAHMLPWTPQGPPFNLSSLLCGSEGTLGLITKARVKLVSLPKHTLVIGAHYHLIDDALQSVSIALRHQAAAVELLDDYLLKLTKLNPEQARNRFWISGDPNAVLLIELYGETPGELADRAQRLISELKSLKLGHSFSIVKEEQVQQVWAMRRAALGLLMGISGTKKTVSFIEDSAVPVKHLPQFVRQVRSLMEQHNTQCVYYGSVSMGLIHLRPLLDLHNNGDRQIMTTLAEEVAQLLKQYGGTISAKHGDGIVRSPYIKTFFGETIVQILQDLKHCFDADNLLNPHKIVHPGTIDSYLRYQPKATSNPDTGFDWGPVGITAAAEQCNGAAACRKLAGTGTMCPSYMATLEEQHSTRGRANTFRQALQENKGFNRQTLALLQESLKFCLSCKACRSECPANVDMAKLKAEFLFQSHRKNGVPKRTTVLSHLDILSRMGSHLPAVNNAVSRVPLIKRILGFSPKRPLPTLAPRRFSQWFATHSAHRNAGSAGKVVLLNDLYSEYYDSALGRCCVDLLEQWGFKVILSPCFASLRLSISLGLLDQARTRLTTALDWFGTQLEQDSFVIGMEPSELLSYRDEAKALPKKHSHIEALEKLQAKMMLFDEFVSDHKSNLCGKLNFKDQAIDIAVHIHCHQKSLSHQSKCIDALGILPQANIQAIPSGCCGMAGFFGYEKQNYELSEQIAELVLLPYIRNLPPTTMIVATGASCRQQIFDFLKIKAFHPAQLIHRQLVS